MHFGIGAFLAFAVLFRRYPYGLGLAWFLVFALQTANETMDAVDWIRWTGDINWRDAAGDYWDTMMWPTVMAVVLQYGLARRDGVLAPDEIMRPSTRPGGGRDS